MTSFRIITDRFTMLGLAMAATLPFLAITPVKAAPATSCAVEAQAVLADAANAEKTDRDAAARAARLVRVAEKICAEGNRFEAAKKFAQARQQLSSNVQLAATR